MEPALFLRPPDHQPPQAVLHDGSEKSVSGRGRPAACRPGLGCPPVAAVGTVGCTEALRTGRASRGGGLPGEARPGAAALRPPRLLPSPAAAHIPPAPLRVSSPAGSPELARDPSSPKGCHTGRHPNGPAHGRAAGGLLQPPPRGSCPGPGPPPPSPALLTCSPPGQTSRGQRPPRPGTRPSATRARRTEGGGDARVAADRAGAGLPERLPPV